VAGIHNREFFAARVDDHERERDQLRDREHLQHAVQTLDDGRWVRVARDIGAHRRPHLRHRGGRRHSVAHHVADEHD